MQKPDSVSLPGGEVARLPPASDAFARQQNANASISAVEGVISGRISQIVLRSQLVVDGFHRVGNVHQSLRGKRSGLRAQPLVLRRLSDLLVR